MSRHRAPRRSEQIHALLSAPLIHDIATEIGNLGRRSRRHPIALHLAWGALARVWHSGNRLDSELRDPAAWRHIADTYNSSAEHHPHGQILKAVGVPLLSDTYRHVREHLTHPEVLPVVSEAFTRHSVAVAQQIGLLSPQGGSRTRPLPERTIYGDGTVVRPIYRPTNTGRRDRDATEHVRHDGPIWGNNLVTVAVRGPEPHRRVLVAVGRVDQPGREADTAIELIRQVHTHAGEGIQAVVYDGAFRGVHHETLMSELGLTVINKVHPARRAGDDRGYRQVPLGQWTHTVRGRPCRHTLVAYAGAVHDSTLDDSGRLVLSDPLVRQQIRRYPRGRRGGFRFSLGVAVPCPKQPFIAWISPHPQPGDPGHGRPDQLRLIPESDPHFQSLYGLRNDAEAINAAYKRTLLADRAAALGWRRQVLDLMSWALLNNTLAWHQHHNLAEERPA